VKQEWNKNCEARNFKIFNNDVTMLLILFVMEKISHIEFGSHFEFSRKIIVNERWEVS
jgi:hypothetical protein